MRWLIELFASPQEVEAIVGDLHEERLQIASSQGDSRARRWYMRQAARTVAHLALSPFRQAPFSLIAFGILCLVITFPVSWATRQVAMAIVVRVPVYEYIPANTFWMASQLSAPFVTGFIGAWVMRNRAMPTALSAFAALMVLVFVIDPLVLSFAGPQRMLAPGFIIVRALTLLGSWGATLLVGTAIGIKLRRTVLRDQAPVESPG
jgi:hypothetical protein